MIAELTLEITKDNTMKVIESKIVITVSLVLIDIEGAADPDRATSLDTGDIPPVSFIWTLYPLSELFP